MSENNSQLYIFSKDEMLFAAGCVIPAFALVVSGEVYYGIPFAIGVLPTALLGIAKSRKQRFINVALGCVFGLGIYIGAQLAGLDAIWLTAIIFFALSYASSLVASRRKIGVVLLVLLLPSLGVGLGYDIQSAFGLALAFMAGSVWAGVVSVLWGNKTVQSNVQSFKINNPKFYGLMLGLAASISVLTGYYINPAYAGWTATATLLIMRPYEGMVKMRGLWRAISTIAGAVVAILIINISPVDLVLAVLVASAIVFVVSTRKSSAYLVPFATAFLILIGVLYGISDAQQIKQVSWSRIADNIIGSLIALLLGYVVPTFISKKYSKKIDKN